jgi:hypothetical protein
MSKDTFFFLSILAILLSSSSSASASYPPTPGPPSGWPWRAEARRRARATQPPWKQVPIPPALSRRRSSRRRLEVNGEGLRRRRTRAYSFGGGSDGGWDKRGLVAAALEEVSFQWTRLRVALGGALAQSDPKKSIGERDMLSASA